MIYLQSEMQSPSEKTMKDLLAGKSAGTVELFNHFIEEYKKIGKITLHPAKTMIGIATPRKRIAYVTQLGKNFIHVVIPFKTPYPNNLCFQKIAQVPDDNRQYNHHLRLLAKEDVNAEVKKFMKLAFQLGS